MVEVDNASVSENDNIEVLSIERMVISVNSVYTPPIETFSLPNAVTDGYCRIMDNFADTTLCVSLVGIQAI